MEHKDIIQSAYRLTGSNSFYDANMAGTGAGGVHLKMGYEPLL